MSEKAAVRFEFQPSSENILEARLIMEFGGRSEVTGKQAEKLWGKIRDIVDKFPKGPTIVGGLSGR